MQNNKNITKTIYKYPSYLISRYLSNLFPRLLVRQKFGIVTVFSNTSHGRGSIGDTFITNMNK